MYCCLRCLQMYTFLYGYMVHSCTFTTTTVVPTDVGKYQLLGSIQQLVYSIDILFYWYIYRPTCPCMICTELRGLPLPADFRRYECTLFIDADIKLHFILFLYPTVFWNAKTKKTWHRTWGPYPLGLPLTSLCDLPLLFVYVQVNNGVLHFLDYEDIYIMALSVLVSM